MFSLVGANCRKATSGDGVCEIQFLISSWLGGVGLYIRLSMEDDSRFWHGQGQERGATLPLVEILTNHRRPVLHRRRIEDFRNSLCRA